MGRVFLSLADKAVWGNVVSSPSGSRKRILAHFELEKKSGDDEFAIFFVIL